MDDGTCARLDDNHYLMTTTTAAAGQVMRHMDFVHQVLRPDLDLTFVSVTEQWAQFAVAGPNSREALNSILVNNINNETLPYMGCSEVQIGDVTGRLFRISFSGELAFEIAVPTRYGDAMMRRLMKEGEEFDVTPYGTEALGVMRIEKGHAAGNELNGTTSALNLGMGRMVSKKKDSLSLIHI